MEGVFCVETDPDGTMLTCPLLHTIASDTIASDTIASDTIASDTIASDTIASDTIASDTIASDTSAPVEYTPDTTTPALTRMGRPMRNAATKVAARIASILSWENATENSKIVRETADIIDMEIALDHKRKKRRTMALDCFTQTHSDNDSEDDAGADDDANSSDGTPSIPDTDTADSEFTSHEMEEDQEEDADESEDSESEASESDEELEPDNQETHESQEEPDEEHSEESDDMRVTGLDVQMRDWDDECGTTEVLEHMCEVVETGLGVPTVVIEDE
jgi:hypothetical protein